MPTTARWDRVNIPTDPEQYLIGYDGAGQPVTINLGDAAHALIVGPAGTGKTHLLQVFADQALLRGAKVRIGNVRGSSEWDGWDERPGVVYAESLILACTMVQATRMEMYRRLSILGAAGIVRAADASEEFRGVNDLAPLLVIVDLVDDFVDYERGDDEDTAYRNDARMMGTESLEQLARQGRSAGVHLLLSAARAGGELRRAVGQENFGIRISTHQRDDALADKVTFGAGQTVPSVPADARGYVRIQDGLGQPIRGAVVPFAL